MKGRLSTVLWRAVTLNLVALLAIFTLAYGAGSHSGGLSILDFGALPGAAGLRLWAAAMIFIFSVMVLVWMTTRILHPMKQLTEFSEHLGSANSELLPLVISGDDFGLIAEHLRTASDQLATAAADLNELTSLRFRISEFSEVVRLAAEGDFRGRAVAGDDHLGQALGSLNTALEAVSNLLQGTRLMVGRARDTADSSIQTAQQAGRTLAQQERQITLATDAFAVLPPSIKQAADNSEAVYRAARNADAAAEQARQSIAGTQSDLQQLVASLRTARDTLSGLRTATEQVAGMLRPLSEITERANLLALNAALEGARAGQAGRTSALFAEQFRDLAQESNKVSGDIATLMAGIQADCGVVLNSVEHDSQAAQAAEATAARASRSLESAAASLQEAGCRAEVLSLASARQADAARSVSGALQSTMDLERLAAQQTRLSVTAAEQLLKTLEELKSALGTVRTSGYGITAVKARVAVNDE
jgi:methyl-accepting chemotaxis protein